MIDDKKYQKLESVNCWIDTITLCICSSLKDSDIPDVDNAKPISDIEPTWYLHLSNNDREFISNLLNKKEE
jgi:hypothetical protein